MAPRTTHHLQQWGTATQPGELLPVPAHLQIGLCLRIGCTAALHKQQGPQDGEAKLESGELWQPAPAQLLVEQLIDVDVGFSWPEGLKATQLSREQLMDLQSDVRRQHELRPHNSMLLHS